MSGRIFINYRRGDDPGFTQALYQKLESEFGRESLFMDVEGYIKAGDDFIHVLEAQVAQADVLLAVIGPRWIGATNEVGERRLDNPDDFVRIEIASALDQGKRVIPVLVNSAEMPRSDALPENLKALARRNARRLTIERFAADCAGLVKDLRTLIDDLDKARAAKTVAERIAAEEGLRRKAEEEAERTADAERQAVERARDQAAARMSANEIRRSEELANWDFIRAKSNVAELRNHLARFPQGSTEAFAMAALEERIWKALGDQPDAAALEGFLAEFQNGKYAYSAKLQLAAWSERAEQDRLARRRKRERRWALIQEAKRRVIERVFPLSQEVVVVALLALAGLYFYFSSASPVEKHIARVDDQNEVAVPAKKFGFVGPLHNTQFSGGSVLFEMQTNTEDDCILKCRSLVECVGVSLGVRMRCSLRTGSIRVSEGDETTFTRADDARASFSSYPAVQARPTSDSAVSQANKYSFCGQFSSNSSCGSFPACVWLGQVTCSTSSGQA